MDSKRMKTHYVGDGCPGGHSLDGSSFARRPDGHRETVDHEQLARERADGTRCEKCGMRFGADDVRVPVPGDTQRSYHKWPCAWLAGADVALERGTQRPEYTREDLFGA